MSRPFVSVLTPTYNRRKFIPTAIACFKAQTYPQDRMEWIVLDDGTDKVGDLFAASGLKNVRYVAVPDGEKLPIGAKRNMINEMAKGDICVCWDDDDYYVPDRVRHAVMRLQGQKMAPVAGSTEIYMYFPDRDEIWSAGPYNPNHATNGTMAYWRSYAKTHKYDDTAVKAEERTFMNDWKTPVAQLRPENTMLVINHGINTYDKRKMIHVGNKAIKKLSLKLKTIIKDKKIRDFYLSLRDEIPPYVHVEDGGSGEPDLSVATPDTEVPRLEVEEKPAPVRSLSERMWELATESSPQAVSPAVEPPVVVPPAAAPDHESEPPQPQELIPPPPLILPEQNPSVPPVEE